MKSFLFLCVLFLSAASLFAQSYTRTLAGCDAAKAVFDGSDKIASGIDGAENLYIAGYSKSGTSSLPSAVYIRKYSKAGTLIWETKEPLKANTPYPVNKTFAFTVYKNGESVIAFNTYTAPDMNIQISKFDSSGKKLWQNGFNSYRNIDDEQPRKIITDTSGNIYLLLTESYDRNRYISSYVLKYGFRGVYIWNRELTGAKLNDTTYTNYTATDFTVDSAGSVYVTGNYQRPGSQYTDIYTYKLFNYGTVAWSKVVSGDNGTDSRGYTIRFAKQDNTVVMCGTTRKAKDSLVVIKYKTLSNGKEVWNAKFPTQDSGFIGHSLIDADNNIFFTTAFNVHPAKEAYVSKVSSSGALVWNKIAFPIAANSQYDPCQSFDAQTDLAGNYYTTFNKNGRVLLQKYDKLGNILFQDTYGPGSDTTGGTHILYGGLSITPNQDIYLTSLFYNSNDLTTNTCRAKYKLNKNSLLADEKSSGKMAPALSSLPAGILYPNPARNVVNLSASVIAVTNSIRMYDATGRQVAQRQLSSGQTKIDVSTLKPGVYTLQLLAGTQQLTYKFIKE